MASRTRWLVAPVILASAALVVGCASGEATAPEPAPAAGGSDAPAFDLLPEEYQEGGVIRIAMASTAPPFSAAAEGKWSGLIPELAAAAEPMLGIEIELVDTPYPNQVASLKAGKVDLVWGATGDTPAREEVLDLVSFMRSTASPMILKSDPASISDDDDLCGLVVGTIQGGDLQRYLEEKAAECDADGKPIDVRLYDTSSGATAQLQSGQIDTLLGIDMIQRYAAAALDDGNVFEVLDVHVVPTIYGISFNKGETKLQEAFMEALRQIIDNGDYAKVFEAYDAESSMLTSDEVMVNGVGAGKL